MPETNGTPVKRVVRHYHEWQPGPQSSSADDARVGRNIVLTVLLLVGVFILWRSFGNSTAETPKPANTMPVELPLAKTANPAPQPAAPPTVDTTGSKNSGVLIGNDNQNVHVGDNVTHNHYTTAKTTEIRFVPVEIRHEVVVREVVVPVEPKPAAMPRKPVRDDCDAGLRAHQARVAEWRRLMGR
jgi:hypothetical protein